MITRATIEMKGKCFAGPREAVGEYTWSRVLGRFDMYSLNADESVSPHLVKDGYWESWITTWFINNLKPGTRFFDVGANTGYYSFLGYSLCKDVVAFEPNPTYADMIIATAKRSGIDERFAVSRFALSNYNGEAVLNIPKKLHGSASLSDIAPQYEVDKVKVSVRELDELFTFSPDPVLMKIDAEGEEERILEGAKRFLARGSKVTIMLEYTPGAYTESFIDHLFNKWSVTWINFSGAEEEVSKEWITSQSDWVMLVLR